MQCGSHIQNASCEDRAYARYYVVQLLLTTAASDFFADVCRFRQLGKWLLIILPRCKPILIIKLSYSLIVVGLQVFSNMG